MSNFSSAEFWRLNSGLFRAGCRQCVRAIAFLSPYLAGTLLVMASYTKLISFRDAQSFLQAGTLASLISVELAVGLSLIFADNSEVPARFALLMFVLFTGYIVHNHYYGGAPCGCGAGEQFFATGHAQFQFSLTRNLIVIASLFVHQRASVSALAKRLRALVSAKRGSQQLDL